jgi:hypothetical protein
MDEAQLEIVGAGGGGLEMSAPRDVRQSLILRLKIGFVL